MGKFYSLEEAAKLPPQLKAWAYNALDVTGTREVFDTLYPRLTSSTAKTYAFERALQNPAFSMMTRGVNVNVPLRAKMVAELKRELDKAIREVSKLELIETRWDKMEKETGFCTADLGAKRHKWPRGVPDGPDKRCEKCGVSRLKKAPFNPNSTDQVKHLFYSVLKISPMYNKKGDVSVDDDVLDRIRSKHPEYADIVQAIQNVRDLKKQLGSLNAKLTPDNRYPSSFNVGAAWTGRFSSSKNPYQQGGNLQNVSERHRKIFLPDPGYTLFYADLKQAESNVVAHLAQDPEYINAHLSGDVHTYVTRLVWPEMPWTGDLKADKKIAKSLPEWDKVEGHDFRFQAKRIQHGSNFGLTPPGIAMIAHIPQLQARKAQAAYFTAFPGIPAWQGSIRKEVKEHRPLVNLLGRQVILMGRPWDEHTVKQGLAFKPQSTVADVLDLAMLRVWLEFDPECVMLLAQVHDAILGQVKTSHLHVMKRLIQLMEIPISVHGRIMKIEPELAMGMNWGHKSKDNPEGIDEVIL